MAAPTGADHDFANAMFRVGAAFRILRRKTLVGMLVTDEHQVRMCAVQVLPQLYEFRMNGVSLKQAAAEQGVMAVRDDAGIGMLAKIAAQPSFLRRALAAAAHTRGAAIRIQRDDVPHAEVVTVIALVRRTCQSAPVFEIFSGCRAVLVVSQRWPGPILEAPPGGSVTVAEIRRGAIFVS